MPPKEKKLQKVRTFHSDLKAAQGVAPAVAPEPTTSIPPPKVNLPPVLNVKRPYVPPPPPPVKPVENPPAPVSVANKSLDTALNTSISTLQKKPNYSGEDRLSVMDTDSEIMEGNIITDQKRERFKLFPAMAQAVGMWFQEGKEAIEDRAEKKRLATPMVRTIEERQEVVKKAASQSAIAPKDDHAKLAAKRPTEVAQEVPKPQPSLMIKEKAAVKPAGWSHYEGVVPAPVKSVPISEAPAVTATPLSDKAPILPPPPPKPEPAVEVAAMKPLVLSVKKSLPPPPPVQPVVSAPPPIPPPPPPISSPAPPSPKPQTPPPISSPTPQPLRFKPSPATGPSWLFYVGVVTTAVIAIGAGASGVWWFFGNNIPENSPAPVVATTNFTTLVLEDSIYKTTLSKRKIDWYSEVSNQSGGGLIVVLPIVSTANTDREAATSELITTLSWRANSAFLRSIERMNFVSYNGEPGIVLRTSSFDAAFGGILLSESELSSDLSPLFGDPVVSSYEIDTGIVPAYFVDDLSGNHDVRVLRDELENERIVYGFTSQNTLIIAPNKATFAALAERVR